MSARLVGGRYRLQVILGRGGMAAVWRGVDTRLDRPVAVKLLDAAAQADPTMLQRLDSEARTVAGLAHPKIVAVYDLGTDGGLPYLVMELVEGEDLHQRLGRGPLRVGEAVDIATQVCAALAAAHKAGVVHRDIKPGNILLSVTGAVKVCDFGIARLQAAQTGMTRQGTAVGTSEYMAPEHIAGSAVDARADLYSLGCVLYAMLTGRPPFCGDNPMRVLWQHVNEPPAPVASHRRDIPADLDALIGQLLAKNPDDRPANADDVRARLTRASGQPATAVFAVHAPAVEPARPAQARASVVARTQSLPLLAGEPAPDRSGVRLGPAGIAAVALGAATLAASVVAALMLLAAQPGTPPAAPGATATATVAVPATTAAVPSVGPAGHVDTVRAILQAQTNADQVEANAAADLNDRLDEIARYLSEGETRKAAKKIAEVRRKLSDFRKDDEITTAAYDQLSASLALLADSLPPTGNDGDND